VRFLKRLQLQGYKTFASHTDFVFDAGVTAIVGPNGSGKSNIADGLRWVLGEQSFGALRGKRTEDMIFSGSEQRPRLGMAYVSLTLDNSSGWLPIDFSEVEIARRAYRSGDNEYYLNGNRVRLRDVTEILASSGLSERTYTVIGQGLVDQALSQRPEERRKLFEEAAGVTVHQGKREQAAQKVAEAQANLIRARDIINELTPRLRYLKGQARRAQEYQQIKQDLQAHLQVWYSYKWRQAHLVRIAARQRVADEALSVAEHSDKLGLLLERTSVRREERSKLRDQLSDWHAASSLLHRQAEGVQRELAVRSEQLRLWGEQLDGIEQEIVHLRAVLEDGAERLLSAQTEVAAAEAAHDARLARVMAAEEELHALESEREARMLRFRRAQEEALVLRSRLIEERSLLSQSGRRREELEKAKNEQAGSWEAASRQIANLERQNRTLAQEFAGIQATLATLAQEGDANAAMLSTAQQAVREATEGLNAAQRDLGRLQDQHDLLSRLREEGAGLAAGPRTIMSARTKLEGIVGTLGELIEAPRDLERAIEAALGGRLQDIVVRRWEDAETAVAYLKESRGGRATFLPLDTLRPARAVTAPRASGVLGLAIELVKFDEAIRPAVELALNHVLVVSDLSTARRLLREPRNAAQGLRQGGAAPTLVTLEGEIVRPSGSVTGGSEDSRRDVGMLSRARSLRELPAKLQETSAQVARWEARMADAGSSEESARGSIEQLRIRRGQLTGQLERLRSQQQGVQLALERSVQTRAWHEARQRDVVLELTDLEEREAKSRGAMSDLDTQIAAAEIAEQAVQRELASLPTEELMAELARLRGEATVSAGQRRSYRARVDELTAQQQQRAGEVAAKKEKVRALAALSSEASRSIAELDAANESLTAQVGKLAGRIEPTEARLAEIEREQRAAESQEQSIREETRRVQMRHSQAELALQRVQDELEHLSNDIEKELGLVAMSPSEGWEAEELADSQPPLPLDEMITPLQAVVELPEGLDEDVHNLRAQLARLGPVNLEALSEYQEVDARCNFLTSQAADLEAAVASLHEIIAELDRVMEREFLATFRAVAGRFRDEFKELLGGGSARLVLTDPESPNTTGVEIIARPPGKREQGLALLSGGERSLTAAALIFSILKSRPTPFCVLDEVDAMLDEANVGRFRDKLRELSEQTQFILITHNRGTIEIADTLYGVSMGADNTSQVVSLKLQGREIVPANQAEID
jgi:chromosome segregation protein